MTPLAPNPRPTGGRIALRFLLGVLLFCGILFGWYYLRGTWSTTTPTDPATPEQGVRSELVRNAEGDTEIRTATVIPVPVATAWKLLSNYEEWEQLFKTVRRKQVAEPLGDNKHHVVSDVVTPMGTISLDFIVTHEQQADGGYRAWWDAPTHELPVNRGTMSITPVGPEQTLFVYTVQKQYRQYPQFLVNNMLLDQQVDLVRTLRQRMIELARKP